MVSREVTCVRASAVQVRCEQAMRVQLRSAVRAHVAHPRLNNRACASSTANNRPSWPMPSCMYPRTATYDSQEPPHLATAVTAVAIVGCREQLTPRSLLWPESGA